MNEKELKNLAHEIWYDINHETFPDLITGQTDKKVDLHHLLEDSIKNKKILGNEIIHSLANMIPIEHSFHLDNSPTPINIRDHLYTQYGKIKNNTTQVDKLVVRLINYIYAIQLNFEVILNKSLRGKM